MQTMNLEQLRATVDAGGVSGVTLKGQGAAFYLAVKTRKGNEVVVVTAKGRGGQPPQPRRFVDPRKAMLLLREIGIRELHIDGTQWRPEEGELERSRPDRAEAMKATHAAARSSGYYSDHSNGLSNKDGY